MTKISERLQEAMNNKGVTQSELVRRTGINKGALSCYLNGKYEPKQKAIFALAKALNVSEGWLMGLDIDPKRHITSNIDLLQKYSNDNLEKWDHAVGPQNFNTDELQELINFAQFLLNKRNTSNTK